MSERVDPNLLLELKDYGAVGAEICFNCGACTAMCPLTDDEHPFPRNMIRLAQLGLTDQMLASTDPWLCYYCGDCVETCPRQAEPGETMMALRRWLTAKYDWTGLARKFYTSQIWEFGAIAVVAGLVVLLFALFHGPIVTEQVELNTFAPASVVHLLDWGMAGLLLFFLLSNAFRMWYAVMHHDREVRIPYKAYLIEAWQMPYQFFTQERFAQCNEKSNWLSHFLLVIGYVTMLVLVVFFLPWFQTDEIYPLWHPQRWVGYVATILLLYGAGRALWGRLNRERQMHRFSHPSDWLFPALLITGAITGILVHAFRYLEWPLPTYTIYVAHLAAMVPMLVLEVPFGKWSHLAYRPLALYLEGVKARARQEADKKAGAVVAAG